jgi:hypothetical protein
VNSFPRGRFAIVGLIAMAMVAFFGATTAHAASAAAPAAAAATPLTGTFTDALGGTGTVAGTFTPTRFLARGDQLLAEGVADLTLVDSSGRTVGTESQTVLVPVELGASEASCEILDLVLGPLDLDLLGLVVHLDRVHLNITADMGPGNLLGNLLCAVAGLLDGPSPDLNALVALLAQILALLG